MLNCHSSPCCSGPHPSDVLTKGRGGASGPGIFPRALETVALLRKNSTLPIVGMGGVTTPDHVEQLLRAGANVVGVGSSLFGQVQIYFVITLCLIWISSFAVPCAVFFLLFVCVPLHTLVVFSPVHLCPHFLQSTVQNARFMHHLADGISSRYPRRHGVWGLPMEVCPAVQLNPSLPSAWVC